MTLAAHVAELREVHGLETRFTRHGVDKIPAGNLTLGLYRIAQEALRNVVRHSGARQAHLSLMVTDDEARLAIADDGIGFDPEDDRPGLGLISMRERARLLDGRLRATSAPAAGTEIEAVLPLSKR